MLDALFMGFPVGVIAQLVERRVRNAKVWSSILHGSTIFSLFIGTLRPGELARSWWRRGRARAL